MRERASGHTVPARLAAVLASLSLVALVACQDDGSDAATTTTSGATAAPSTSGSTVVPTTAAGAATSDPSTSAPPTADEVAATPLLGTVMQAPVPFEGSDGAFHLVYEIFFTNFTRGDAVPTKVEVLDAATGSAIATLDAAAITTRLQAAGNNAPVDRLTAGQSGVLYMHVTLPDRTAVPKSLGHRVTVTIGDTPFDEQIAPTTIDERTVPVLGPPLAGAGYVAADGCCDSTRHVRAYLPLDGELFNAQRYAIDYEQVDAAGRIYDGPKEDVASYEIFGKEALAVADGTVTTVVDGLAEQKPGVFPANIELAEADGNSVVIDIGDGLYANYAHMQPGSLRVKVGDKVSKGDVLGLVGNTGNSLAPHLHLHIMDGPSFLASEGVPYVVDSFTITGQIASTGDFDTAEADGTPAVTRPGMSPTEHRDQYPLDQSIVTFAGP